MSDTNVVKVGPKGRIVIPARVRDQLQIEEGDELVLIVDHDVIHLAPRRQVIASLRGSLASESIDLVAELLDDRRRAAAAGR